MKTDSWGYHPRFSLAIDTEILPNLRLSAGGTAETTVFQSTTDHIDAKSTSTTLRPYFNLTLNSAPYTLGAGYYLKEDIQKIKGGAGLTNFRENYNGLFGWKPDGLPSVDLLLSRNNYYDKDRELQDITTDSILLALKYNYKTLDLKYQASYDDQKDKLNKIDTTSLLQTGRIAYSDSFFNRRVSFNTSYNITRQDTTVASRGAGGEISNQVFPFTGLFVVNLAASPIALIPNSALIDGDTALSAGINIGVPPLGGDTTSLRQVGLDFLVSAELNQLLLWIDRDLSAAPNIRDFFISDPNGIRVYQSSDNLNWTLVPLSLTNPISFSSLQSRFDINFAAPITTRYIKVVTRPLPAVVAALEPTFPNPDIINITELQAFLRQPVDSSKKTRSNTTFHLVNVDAKVRILDIPLLFYDFSSFYSTSSPNGVSQYTISNGLSASHRFSEIFSGTARGAVDINSQASTMRTDYLYDMSLTATPLRTLTHNLIYSGRVSTGEAGTSNTNSLSLNNSATLYKGFDLYLNGAVNYVTKETDEKVFGTTVSLGTNVIPHPTLTINASVSNTTSNPSGGDQAGASSWTRSGDLNVTFSPVRSLYFFGSITVASQKNFRTGYLQNYAVGWSPFSGGDLQFNFAYTEALRSEDKGRDTSIGPTVRWNITRRSSLDATYQWVKSKSISQKSESNVFSTRFHITF